MDHLAGISVTQLENYKRVLPEDMVFELLKKYVGAAGRGEVISGSLSTAGGENRCKYHELLDIPDMGR